MADAARANLLAAIRAKGQTPPVEAPVVQPVDESKRATPPSLPIPTSQNVSSSKSVGGRGRATAVLAQIRGNTGAKLKSTTNESALESDPVVSKLAVRHPSHPGPPENAKSAASKGSMPFSASDPQTQIKLHDEKEAVPLKPLSTSHPKLDLSKIGTKIPPVLSYRSEMVTRIDPQTKVKPQLTCEKEEPVENVKPKITESSMKMKNSSSREVNQRLSSKGIELSSDKPALPLMVAPSTPTDSRRGPQPFLAVTQRCDKSSEPSPITSSSSPATPKPSKRVQPLISPSAVSPPGSQRNGSEYYRLLTEPSEVAKVWRKLSCRVLREGESYVGEGLT